MPIWLVSEEERTPSEDVGERQKLDLLGSPGNGKEFIKSSVMGIHQD